VISDTLFCAFDGESEGDQPSDKVSVNRGSRSSVVFANRAAEIIRHEEDVALHCEADGVA
jgi:hypothetical protein